jgi:hypothetical protein
MHRNGHPLGELFNEAAGPLKQRPMETVVVEGKEQLKRPQGAVCFECGLVCKRSNKSSFLAHISAQSGDPGGGWAPCKHQDNFDVHKRAAWRVEFLAMVVAKDKSRCASFVDNL